MGVCINYRFAVKKEKIKVVLDDVQEYVNKVISNIAPTIELSVEQERLAEQVLYVHIEGIETLVLDFRSMADIENEQERDGWGYEYQTLLKSKNPIPFFTNEYLYCSAFSKTQYGKPVSHVIACQILKKLEAVANWTSVNDEGEYYHTGKIDDLTSSLEENQAVIDTLLKTLKKTYWGTDKV